MAEAQSSAPVRGRPFPKGVSGNPGGMLARIRDVQLRVIEKWSPEVDKVMAELLRLATGAMTLKVNNLGDTFDVEDGPVRVAAAKAFLQHACPQPRQDSGKGKDDEGGDEGDDADAIEKAVEVLLSKPELREQLKAKLGVIDGGKKR